MPQARLDRCVTVLLRHDLLVAAAGARVYGDLLTGMLTSPARRLRSSELVIFCAVVLFLIAWVPVNWVRDPLPTWEAAVSLHPELRIALVGAQAAGWLVFLATLAGGLPLLWEIALQAISARRRDILGPLFVPLFAATVLVAYALPASSAWTTQRPDATPTDPFTPLALVLQAGFVLLSILAVAGSTAGLVTAVLRGAPSERALRFALSTATVATLAMAAALAATLVLSGLAIAEAPELLPPSSLAILGLLMAGTLAVAVVALQRGWSALRSAT